VAWSAVRLLRSYPESIPDDVWAYLLPIEDRVVAVRKHPAMLAWRVLLLLADLTAFALTAAGVSRGGPVILAMLGVGFAVFAFLAWDGVVVWSRTFFVLAGTRIILVNWQWGRRRMAVISLNEAVDMVFVRTALGRFAGYGSFRIRPAGGGRRWRRISYLPYPEQLYIEVCGLIYLEPRR
jgi:hypothetical protein